MWHWTGDQNRWFWLLFFYFFIYLFFYILIVLNSLFFSYPYVDRAPIRKRELKFRCITVHMKNKFQNSLCMPSSSFIKLSHYATGTQRERASSLGHTKPQIDDSVSRIKDNFLLPCWTASQPTGKVWQTTSHHLQPPQLAPTVANYHDLLPPKGCWKNLSQKSLFGKLACLAERLRTVLLKDGWWTLLFAWFR